MERSGDRTRGSNDVTANGIVSVHQYTAISSSIYRQLQA